MLFGLPGITAIAFIFSLLEFSFGTGRYALIPFALSGLIVLPASAVAIHARSTSATDQACEMQPRGAKGASPSKISLILPSPCTFKWVARGSRNRAACFGSVEDIEAALR